LCGRSAIGASRVAFRLRARAEPTQSFYAIPWDEADGLQFASPPARSPGSYVLFRAEMDLVIAFSECPQDVLPINGRACRPVVAHVMVI